MEGMSSPLLRPYSLNPLDRIADGVVTVLLQSGVQGLSVGAIGRAQRTSAQAFHQYVSRFRHETETSATAALHRIAAQVITGRWLEWDAGELRLPETEEERDGVAVWVAFQELVRGRQLAGDPLPAEILTDARTHEVEQCRLRLAPAPGRPPGRSDVVALVALADGLRAELLRPQPALSLEDAKAVLDRRRSEVRNDAARPAA